MCPKVKKSYENVLEVLEWAYLQIQEIHEEQWRAVWDRGRVGLLEERGWTEDEFYEEMSRRRRRG